MPPIEEKHDDDATPPGAAAQTQTEGAPPAVADPAAPPPPAPTGPGDESTPPAPGAPAEGAPAAAADPTSPGAAPVFDAAYVASLRDEAAGYRVAARDAREELERVRGEADQKAADAEQKAADAERRLAEAERQLADLDKAIELELDRRLSELADPDRARRALRGSTARERLEHLADLVAAGLVSAPAPLPSNPPMPAPVPQRTAPEAPRSYTEWATWPVAKAKLWRDQNPQAFAALKSQAGR